MLHNLNIRKVLSSKSWLPVRQMYGMGRFNDVWVNAVNRCFFGDLCSYSLNIGDIFCNYRTICKRVQDADSSWIEEDSDDSQQYSETGWYLMQIPKRFYQMVNGVETGCQMRAGVTELVKNEALFGITAVRRTGWTRVIPAFFTGTSGSDRVETVAEHSIKVAILAACLNPECAVEAFEMGLCHDMAECLVGDLTPGQMPDREEKHRLEANAFETLISGLPNETMAKLRTRFVDYMENQTNLTHTVHLADKLDMALQAIFYEHLFHIDLQEFLDSASQEICQNYEKLHIPQSANDDV